MPTTPDTHNEGQGGGGGYGFGGADKKPPRRGQEYFTVDDSEYDGLEQLTGSRAQDADGAPNGSKNPGSAKPEAR